jgi:predicted PurR-regulated permease PerM
MYIAIFAGIALFSVSVAPVIREQAVVFREQAPVQIAELEQVWQESPNPLLSGVGRDLLLRVIDFLEGPATDIPVPEGAANMVIGFATSIGGGVIGLLTTLVIAFYYLMEKNWLRQLALDQLRPSNREHVARILESVDSKVGDWMRGQLVLMLVIGLSATIAYGVLGIRFWPLLGLWAGLTELIPIVGPWLGGIPAVIIALTQGWDKALITVGVIVLLQSLENYVLVPRVMRGAVGLTPMTVFLAILAGTQFLGILGAVLAIPVAAAIQVLLSDYFRARRENYLAETPAAATSWQWMRGQRVAMPDGGELTPAESEAVVSRPRQSPARSAMKRRGLSRDISSRPPPPGRDDEQSQ